MSELTSCNYCSLAGIRRRAHQDRQRLVIRPARKKDKYFMGGWDVYRFSKALMTRKQFDGLTDEEQEHYWVCWFMEITDHCVC